MATGSRARRIIRLPVFGVFTAACAGPQSVLDPAGPSATSIHTLGVVMYVGAVLVTLLVTALMLAPFVRRREPGLNRRLFLWGGGVALPFVALSLLLPYVLSVGNASRPDGKTRISVDVTGNLWWWQMAYRREGKPLQVTSANELRLPAGERVELLLHTNDVIHSLWIPNLAGKMDLIPGRVNRMVIHAGDPGIFRGQCAEFCGAQHALMALDVIVMPRAEFDAWLAQAEQPPPDPQAPSLREGRDLFVTLGCGACHTIRGVSAGAIGPDLTHVGSRRSIGAGALPGGVGNIAAWIASAQHIKPGVAMPSYDRLQGAELRAVADYLASLK